MQLVRMDWRNTVRRLKSRHDPLSLAEVRHSSCIEMLSFIVLNDGPRQGRQCRSFRYGALFAKFLSFGCLEWTTGRSSPQGGLDMKLRNRPNVASC